MARYEFDHDDLIGLIGFLHAETRDKADETQFKICPYCQSQSDKWTFSVNNKSGAFCCLRASCGRKGHFIEMCRDFGYEIDDGSETEYRKLKQPENGHYRITDGAIEYLKKRGISESVTRAYQVTASESKPSMMIFPFFNQFGEVVHYKFRNMMHKKGDKSPKEWSSPGTRQILFGVNLCEDFERLVITEGQIDAMSVAEAGIKNAVSVPNGCQSFGWAKNCWDWLIKFDTVVVFGDWENGHMTLLDEIRKRLPNRILSVCKGSYLGEKDANDILINYGPEAVRRAVEDATADTVEKVKDLSDVHDVDVSKLPKIKTGITQLDAVLGGLCLGTVTLLTGKRGEGKSTLMSQIGANALDDGKTVLFYSAELPGYRFKHWLNLQLAGKDHIQVVKTDTGCDEYVVDKEALTAINKWYAGRAYIYDSDSADDDDQSETGIIDTVERAVKQFGINLVCIDNLMTAMETISDQKNLYLAQSNFVGKLEKVAKKHSIAIVLVAHERKSGRDQAFDNDSVSGAAEITNKVDNVIRFAREKKEEGADGAIYVTKNRYGGTLLDGNDRILVKYSPKTKRILEYGDTAVRVYGWEKRPEADAKIDSQTGYEEVTDDDIPF